jgi:hypothetical protein
MGMKRAPFTRNIFPLQDAIIDFSGFAGAAFLARGVTVRKDAGLIDGAQDGVHETVGVQPDGAGGRGAGDYEGVGIVGLAADAVCWENLGLGVSLRSKSNFDMTPGLG